MENLCVVQYVARPGVETRTTTGLFGPSAVKPRNGMAALHASCATSLARDAAKAVPVLCSITPGLKPLLKKGAEKKRPVRGDNRTGQAIWALGWMGARA